MFVRQETKRIGVNEANWGQRSELGSNLHFWQLETR